MSSATRRPLVATVGALASLAIVLTACSSNTDGATGSAGTSTSTTTTTGASGTTGSGGAPSPTSSASTAPSSESSSGAETESSSGVSQGSPAPSSESSTSASPSTGGDVAPMTDGASQVAITLQNNTCTLDHAAAAAGPVTFTVTNVSASGLTEIELQQDQRIIGEKENLAPGLPAVKFTSTLDGGTYVIYCPGADTESQNFTVTGTAPTPKDETTAELLQAGTKTYGTYVAGVLADMVTAVDNLNTAVDSGNVADARVKYALARPFYEKVESDVDGFVLPGFTPDDNAGFLDYLIDMRASNLDPAVGWHGFHAIERDLFTGSGKITASTKQLAAELDKNVKTLAGLAKGLTYQPEDLANGASGLLEEVQTNKIKGEEESYSHLDLLDFAANVEGAQQAFANLKPGLEKIDPALTETISQQFDAVNAALDKYHDPSQPGGFVLWTPELRQTDAASLSKAVQALQDPLSQIAQKVATV